MLEPERRVGMRRGDAGIGTTSDVRICSGGPRGYHRREESPRSAASPVRDGAQGAAVTLTVCATPAASILPLDGGQWVDVSNYAEMYGVRKDRPAPGYDTPDRCSRRGIRAS